MSVNGSQVTPAIEHGYAAITRRWKAGDRIDLSLPMQVQRIREIDKNGLLHTRYNRRA